MPPAADPTAARLIARSCSISFVATLQILTPLNPVRGHPYVSGWNRLRTMAHGRLKSSLTACGLIAMAGESDTGLLLDREPMSGSRRPALVAVFRPSLYAHMPHPLHN